ncbi:MAG: HAD family hydrolase, partial [Clostridia bacterium]|nr:HAD family hydrolase [Clostridia bacterium]
MGVFDKTKYFIVDMDGTFYLDGGIIPGSDDFLNAARQSGRDFYFFTNNSSNNVEVCRAKLEKMGFPVDEKRVIISSHVAADFMNRNHPGKRIFLLGNERLTKDCLDAGLNLVDSDPDIVLLGFDTTLTYQKIWDAVRFLDAGALYYATHPDRNCPTADGYM